MRKTYMMLLALVLTMLGASDAMAQKIYRAELDNSMFKAWDGCGADAQETEPVSYVGKGDATVNFECTNAFYKELSSGALLFGNTNVYYKWYANLTGTKKFYFKGTAGVQLRVLMNRVEPVEGSDDPNGGATVEKNVTIGDDGTAELDVTDLEFVHLNAIKFGWGSPAGVLKAVEIEGTVRPVSGLLSMINNGDAEGDDLSSFPVSLDGPNNGESAPDLPVIVAGEGVDGSKCFKVTAFENPTETWHTQFYIKADEVMPKGTKWQLKMSIKADQNTLITSSAQGQPRKWKGDMGLGEIGVSSEWKEFSWSGEIGVDDFQSIAFDLSNENGAAGNAGVSFYFDNIEFGIDLGSANPLSDVKASAGIDVVRVDFGGATNMKDLVAAASTKTLIFDNSTVSLTVDGNSFDENIVSVEGYEDGNLYIFVEEDLDAKSEVKVAFKNPEDAAHQLLFKESKWAGQPVPEFSGMVAPYDAVLADAGLVSYLYGEPEMVEISPEQGSFNLSNDVKVFTVTFNQPILVSSVVAKLGSEALTASAADGDDDYSKVIKLTRTSDAALTGVVELVISAAEGKAGDTFGLANDIVVKYSYGPVSLDGDDQPATIYASNFSSEGDNANGAGWYVNAGSALQPANSGSGCRLMHNQGAFSEDLLYIAQRDAAKGGVAVYGIDDENKLTLEGGKTYHVTLKACRHDCANVALRVQVLPEAAVNVEDGSLVDGAVALAEDFQAITPEKTSKQAISFDLAVTPAEAGNFVIRLVPSLEDGSFAGYNDPVCFGDVKVEYIPNVMGIVETKALQAALADAKVARDENGDERYDGEDYTALANLITEVETNMGSYSAPSVYAAKAAELAAAAKALTDHKAACDSYDANIKKAVDHVANNAENKFKETQVNKDLEAIVAKYHASKVVNNIAEDGEDAVYETVYTFDVLKDNAALTAANAELSKAVSVADQYFTEVALTSDIQQGNSGVAVLVERNRLGARALMSLGVEETDPLIVAVKNSVTDDDMLAEGIKGRIKAELYSKLKDADNDVFGPKLDEFGDPVTDANGEIVSKSYDMTVFIKNPNFYEADGTKGVSEENIPGWTFPAKYDKPGDFKKWGDARNVEGLPEDIAFTTWYGTCRMEQTIEDLPAGVYVVSLCGSDWSNQAGQDDETKRKDVSGFVYCKTSDTPDVIEGEDEDRDINFAATRTIVYGGMYNMDHSINLGYAEVVNDETGFISDTDGEFFGIPVTDGKLTLGIHFGGDAQYFFQHARLTLVGAADFDYANAVATSIENAAAPKVRGIQVYDLNGRRMIKANKGLQIVKKQMSDGSVRVEKVVVK